MVAPLRPHSSLTYKFMNNVKIMMACATTLLNTTFKILLSKTIPYNKAIRSTNPIAAKKFNMQRPKYIGIRYFILLQITKNSGSKNAITLHHCTPVINSLSFFREKNNFDLLCLA